jgi:succinyl-diaminopimelate desuccinylase
MKGSVAVMVELALALAAGAGAAGRTRLDLGLVLFGREELPLTESALTPLLAREPDLRSADLVLMMEPTANAIQAGCLGNINASWVFEGRSGHSARPWLADNAIHRAAAGIIRLAAAPPRRVSFDGLEFTEVASVTQIRGGIAQNVVPAEAVATVNARYAPGRDPAEAEAWLRDLCDGDGELRIESNAPSAPVATANSLVEALRVAGDLRVEAKQAWTPIAEFARAGLDAVNFGPGDPAYAHTREERVAVAALVDAYRTLERFACG